MSSPHSALEDGPKASRVPELPSDAPTLFSMGASEGEALVQRMMISLGGLARVTAVWVFGSFRDGGTFRDIDIGVMLNDPNEWRVLSDVEGRVEAALLGRLYKVDIVPLNDTTPAFLYNVVTRGRVLFESAPGVALDIAVRAVSQDMDYREWLHTRESSVRDADVRLMTKGDE